MLRRPHRAELGDGDLEVREHLEEQRLGLDLDAVDLVDQQHDGLAGPDRLQQGAGEQELLGEDVLLELLPSRAGTLPVGTGALDLDAKELLAVVPLIEGLRLVEALVALEPDEARPEGRRGGLGELGLARAGRPLHQHGLVEPVGEVDDGGDLVVGEVPDAAEALGHRRRRPERAPPRPAGTGRSTAVLTSAPGRRPRSRTSPR